MTTNNPSISVCMIVKNEAKNMRRCLDSVFDVADEIIVVDTGSTDDTVAIAKSYGAEVYHSPWRDDFSYHRNESFSHANCDWILQIDADEELVLELDCDLKKQLVTIPIEINAARLIMRDIQDGSVAMVFHPERLFRRGQVKFVNRKHNRPIFDGKIAQLSGVFLHHYGYNSDQIAGKKERDIALLMKMLEDDPDNHQVLFWMAQTYGHYFGDAAKALEYCEEYIEVASKDVDFQPAAYVSCAEIAKSCGDKEKSHRYITDGIARYPDDLDLNFLRVRNAVDDNDARLVEHHADTYLRAYDRMTSAPQDSDGRFVWFYNDESLCYVLHKAAVNYLWKGASYLKTFKDRVEALGEAARTDLERCMDIDMNKIGVGLV